MTHVTESIFHGTMIILHDNRIPSEYIASIGCKLGDAELIPFTGTLHQEIPEVYDSVRCHPDIYFFQIDNNTLVHAPSVRPEQLVSLKEAGMDLINGDRAPSGIYPGTACYNALRVGKHVFHNFDFTDNTVIKEIEKRGLKRINVKQGYVRCSVLAAGSEAIITSDHGVAKTAGKEGFDVLVISTGSILLPGEKYGFLGGTAGILSGNNIIFLGDISGHPDFSAIDKMLKKHGIMYRFIEKLPLYDAGGLFALS